jgi:class 3 adenylate cyclase
MAGVVGKERMQFDVFGDDVNIASRFESSGEKGRINVSEQTYLRTREFFEFEERGEISLKNKASMKGYFVIREL